MRQNRTAPRDQITRRDRMLALAAMMALSASALLLVVRQDAVDTYTTFVAGWAGLAGAAKTRDILLAVAAMVAGLGLSFGARAVANRLSWRPAALLYSEFARYVATCLVPILFGFCAFLTPGRLSPLVGTIGLISLGVVLAVVPLTSSSTLPTRARITFTASTVALCALLPISSAIVRLHLFDVPATLDGTLRHSSLVGLIGFVFATVLLRKCTIQIARTVTMVLQIPLALLYLGLIPITEPNATDAPTVDISLYLLTTILVVLSVVDIFTRWRRDRSALSPLAFGSILVAVAPGLPLFVVSSDDYHLGEYLVSYWSIGQGFLPYVDYDLAHGLTNYLPGLTSALFFDGSAAQILAGQQLSTLLQQLLLFVLLAALLPLPVALLSVLLTMPILSGPFPLLGAWLALLLNRRLLDNPKIWCVAWFATGVALVLFMPGQGSTLVAATIPFGLFMVFTASREAPVQFLALAGSSALVFCILCLATPLGLVLTGALSYVLQNASVNLSAYGINWGLSFLYDHPTSHPLVQAARVSWLLLPALGVWALLDLGRSAQLAQSRTLLLGASVAVLLPFAILSYVFGRVDPFVLSRPGAFAIWVLAFVAPIVFARLRRPLPAALPLLAMVPLLVVYESGVRASDGLAYHLNPPPLSPLRKPDSAHGLANTGSAIVDDVHTKGIKALRAALDVHLEPKEPYLDITGRTAQYVYLDRPIPRLAAAPYNLPDPVQQARLVDQLRDDPPKILLLLSRHLPSMNHDGLSVALRAPLLFRWITLNYEPFEENGLILARPRTGPIGEGARATVAVSAPVRALTDANWNNGISLDGRTILLSEDVSVRGLAEGMIVEFADTARRIVGITDKRVTLDGPSLGAAQGFPATLRWTRDQRSDALAPFDAAFRQADFGWLPYSWGKSAEKLQDEMQPVLDLKAAASSENTSVRTFDLPQPFDGSEAGLLVFDFQCELLSSTPATIRVAFGREGRRDPLDAITFQTRNGRVIVPMDTQPSWLLSRIDAIEVEVSDPAVCGGATIENAALFQRRLDYD